jgi:hypothetical protein
VIARRGGARALHRGSSAGVHGDALFCGRFQESPLTTRAAPMCGACAVASASGAAEARARRRRRVAGRSMTIACRDRIFLGDRRHIFVARAPNLRLCALRFARIN